MSPNHVISPEKHTETRGTRLRSPLGRPQIFCWRLKAGEPCALAGGHIDALSGSRDLLAHPSITISPRAAGEIFQDQDLRCSSHPPHFANLARRQNLLEARENNLVCLVPTNGSPQGSQAPALPGSRAYHSILVILIYRSSVLGVQARCTLNSGESTGQPPDPYSVRSLALLTRS